MGSAGNCGVPSVRHEAIIELLREHPQLVVELIGLDAIELHAPPVDFAVGESSFSQLTEVHADLVLTVQAADGGQRVLIVEVQLSERPEKPGSWVVYQAGAYRRFKCPAYVVVVTLDPAVARWAAGPFFTGQTELRPIVLGPPTIPAITDPAVARENPELTLLSGLAHAQQSIAEEIGAALWHGLNHPQSGTPHKYWDLLLHSINEVARRSLKMRFSNYLPQSDWGKRWYSEGHQAGELAGRRHAERTALAYSLRVLLNARGFDFEARYGGLIDECREPAQLRHWIDRAATAADLVAIFGD